MSPIVAQEICYRAGVDADLPTSVLDPAMEERLYQAFASYIDAVKLGIFEPAVYYDNGEPVEFGVLPFTLYEEKEKKVYDSISELLWSYYSEKSAVTRIRQKSTDLRKIVTTALERNVKKYDLQVKQLADTENGKNIKYMENCFIHTVIRSRQVRKRRLFPIITREKRSRSRWTIS